MPSLYEILEPLEGKSTDKIAELFASEGIHGRRYQARRCPVAIYIAKKASHDPYSISVRTDRIELWDTTEGFVDDVDHYWLTEESPIYSFIIKFDNGYYPELMEG